jgi:hypothetical protein
MMESECRLSRAKVVVVLSLFHFFSSAVYANLLLPSIIRLESLQSLLSSEKV